MNWYFDKDGKPRNVSREYPLPWREYSRADKIEVIASTCLLIIVILLLSFL